MTASSPRVGSRRLLYPAGIIITLLWLVVMAVLIRKELLPRIDLPSDSSGYQTIISSMPVYGDEWTGVYFQDVKVGYSHTSIYPHNQAGKQGYLIANQTTLILSLLGKKTEARTRGNVFIDRKFRLEKFDLKISSDRYSMFFNGYMKDKNLVVCIDSGHTKSTRTIPLDDNIMLAHSLTPFLVLGKLSPGDRKVVNLFDPVSLTAKPAVINALDTELINFGGERTNAQAVEISYEGLEVKAWLNSQGQILRQETSLGWVIVKERQEQALRFSDNKEVDLLKAFSVPSRIFLETPRKIKYLKVKITGIKNSDFDIADTRQTFLDTQAGILEINSEVIRQDSVLSLPIKNDITAEQDLSPYLESTTFIQARDERIIHQAQEIIQDEKNAWAAALKISDCVYNTVKKTVTFSVPSSVDVLKTREGDCNEHTYLFTALARSAGIPARVCIGIVYFENGFYYHAWPMVYVGQWVSLDPTLNQHICDATHIKLLEGELADQMRLAAIIGKLKIEILDYR